MRSLMPRDGFTELREEMDRLLNRLMGEERRDIPSLGEWKPPLDLKETKDRITVTAEIPGIDPKDIHIEVRDDMLILEGQKKHEEEHEDERFYRMERTYGSFSRAVMLPAPVDSTRGNAIFKNGVIAITIPKAQAAKQTTIPVKTE
jgi:HSP20 family protein